MEEETCFEEELTTLESLLDFRESDSKIQAKDFRNLYENLKEFQESPLALDANLRVFLIDENKMNNFKGDLKDLASKVGDLERNFSSLQDEKFKFQEENRILKKQLQDLTDQNMKLLKPKPPQSISLFEPKGPVNYPSLVGIQTFFNPQILQKSPIVSDLPSCYFCNIFEAQIKELNKKTEFQETENKELIKQIEALSQNFNNLLKERNEASNCEATERFWRIQSQIENQKNVNISLQTNIESLNAKLRLYEEREKENMNGLILIKDKITECFSDLIDDGFETTNSNSDCENEIICKYFPETMKRLKLKLQNDSLKERLDEVAKDLHEEKAENKRKVESFLKEVMHFEEIKENTLKKIDDYLLMIKEMAEEKIHKFKLNVEEFQFVDMHCMEINHKLEGSYKLIEDLTEKLGKHVEINRKLMERYEMDILVNKTFLDDLNKSTKEKTILEQEIAEIKKENFEKKEKMAREIDNLNERLKMLEKINKQLTIENELLNLTSKRCNEAINFQLFQHFKLKYENIFMENQVLTNKSKLNQEIIADLNIQIKRKNDEILELKNKIADQNPENLLLTLLNIKDGSLREIIQENMDNKKNIVELNKEVDILTRQINERKNWENPLRMFMNDEIDVEASPEERNRMAMPMEIIELLEKSKMLLSGSLMLDKRE